MDETRSGDDFVGWNKHAAMAKQPPSTRHSAQGQRSSWTCTAVYAPGSVRSLGPLLAPRQSQSSKQHT
eukprot:804806-Amphidinium_carterae.1